MKIVVETLRWIRYKLRMTELTISGPSYIYEVNMLVIDNTQRPDSTLKKKSDYICYHNVHDYVAMGESLTGHVETNKNCTDLSRAGPVLARTLFDIRPSFIGARLKN